MSMSQNIKQHYNKFIGCDLETTGTKAWKHGIVEIGAILVDLEGNYLDSFQSYCNPGDVVYDPKALEINNLTMEFIQSQRPIRDVLIDFVNWMYKNQELWNKDSTVAVVGNNFGFDSGFFQYAFDKHIPELESKTRWMFRRTIELKGYSNAVLPQYPHMAQDKLGKILGIHNAGLHSALGDIEQMLSMYLYMNQINQRRINTELKYDEATIEV